MKRTTIFALLLVLVLSFGFAGTNVYTNEGVGVNVNYDDEGSREKGFGYGADATGHFTLGVADDAETFDVYADLEATIAAGRARNDFNYVGAGFDITPSLNADLHFGIFTGSASLAFNYNATKRFDAKALASEVKKNHSLTLDGDFAFMIPVENRRNFFGVFNSDSATITKDLTLADLSIGFGYFIPRFKAEPVDAYTYSYDRDSELIDDVNDLDVKVEAAFDVDIVKKGTADADIEQCFQVAGTYYLPFAEEDNAFAFGLRLKEIGSKDDIRFVANADAEYFLSFDTGVNALDYFSVDAGIDVSTHITPAKGAKELNASTSVFTLASVHVPHIVPVEMLDEFSLAVPADFSTSIYIDKTTGEKLGGLFNYGINLTPFYWELNNGAKFLNMYINTVKFDVTFGEEYYITEKLTRSERGLALNAAMALDPVQGKIALNCSTLSAGIAFDMKDLKNITKSVTIAFGAEF